MEGSEEVEGPVWPGGAIGWVGWGGERRHHARILGMQSAWGAATEQFPHEYPQVGGSGGDAVAFLNVHQPAQACPSPTARLEGVREGAFDDLSAFA